MTVTGIIAEYNPLHKGHEYQLKEARRLTGADYIIVVMSGCFTQRGTPAVLDKYDRAHMALSCGADLVLELPTRFACASACLHRTTALLPERGDETIILIFHFRLSLQTTGTLHIPYVSGNS